MLSSSGLVILEAAFTLCFFIRKAISSPIAPQLHKDYLSFSLARFAITSEAKEGSFSCRQRCYSSMYLRISSLACFFAA